MKLRALLLASMLASCSATTPTVNETPRPTASTQPTIAPRKPAPVAREAVFAAEGSIWLYTVKTDGLREIVKGANVRAPRWVSDTEVSFVQGAPGGTQGLRLLDIKKQTVIDVMSVETGIDAYSWSPDRETIAYITTDQYDYSHVEYYSLGAGVTQSVATLAKIIGRDTTPEDQVRIAFDRTGQFVLVVDTRADGEDKEKVPDGQSQFQVRTLGGDLAFGVDHYRHPTMGVWGQGGRVLYYRSQRDLRSWKAGDSNSTRVADLRWFHPWPSPDGRFFAYDTGATSMRVAVEMLVPKTRARTAVTKAGFYHPVVASGRVIWVQRVTRCEPDCPVAVTPAPEVFSVDIKTKKMRKLRLPTLSDLDVRYS